MSTLTVADNKGSKKPQYKDYVSFLGNYKNGKRDDQCSVTTSDSGVSLSLNNSSNNSSSSINSDLDTCKHSFKDYLETYNSKKYSPVQPEFIKKPSKSAEGRTVKTEVYIEINNPPSALNSVQKVVDISNVQNSSTSVSTVSKMFEKTAAATTKNVPISSNKVNTFNFEPKQVEVSNTLKRQQKRTSIGDISRKFETNSLRRPEPHKVQLKKTPSISEKSRVFEETLTRNEIRKHSLNETTKAFQQKEDVPAAAGTNGSLSPKPPISTIKPVIAPKTFTEINSGEQKIPAPPPPPPAQTNPNNIPTFIPPPPPLQQNTPCIIPPPPPPPPPAHAPAKTFQSAAKTNTNGAQTPKPDVVDGIPVPAVDKNDPRVKKLVYGALREMYGAYHDKANDYLATLPKNRVRKNNGLDKIINSIASQGGLDKLNGRANPTIENE